MLSVMLAKITRKSAALAIAFIVCTALVIAAVSAVVYRMYQDKEDELASTLSITVATIRRALVIWKEAKTAEAIQTADQRAIRSLIPGQPTYQTSSKDFEDIWQKVSSRSDATGFFIVSSEGQEIAHNFSSHSEPRNLRRDAASAISDALNGTPSMSPPIRSGNASYQIEGQHLKGMFTVVVSAPVRDSAGQVVAALCLCFDPYPELAKITELTRWQRSGEAFVFDKNGIMLTESRFAKDLKYLSLFSLDEAGIITLRDPGGNLIEGYHPDPGQNHPLTQMAKSATQGNPGVDLNGYRDYRGVQVVGAWTWDKDLSVGIAAEIDKAEAFGRFHSWLKILIFFICAIIAGSFALAWLLGSDLQQREAVRGREELLARVAHDLRNPLSSISLTVATLKKHGQTRSYSESELKILGSASRAVERMHALISDLLSAAKIEAGSFTTSLKPQDLSAIIEHSMAVLEPLAREKSINLKVEIPPVLPKVLADERRLLDIFSNLVGNALKFTPANGTIVIRAANQKNCVTVSVCDTGCGIPERSLKSIFRRNWQAPATSGQGIGLGLYIVKGIVEAHGGKIWVESDVGHGTTFFFTLRTV